MLDNTILTVSVPATSANIGVGYDTLGLAFNLRAKITFRESPTLIIDGCPEQFRNDDNLVWTSYIRACEKLGEEPTPKHITIDSPIPLSGGLGSSSTCVIAGIAAAMTESHSGWDPERALDFACHFEGHPDNVAPAIYGGLTSSFVAIAPPYTVNTEDARKVVPQEISLETAVYQMGRTVAVTHALETGNGGLLAAACNDKLHEPYRKELIPDYEELKQVAKLARACTFVISGSGATMVAICDSPVTARAVAENAKQVRGDLWIQILEPALLGTVLTLDDGQQHHNTFDEI